MDDLPCNYHEIDIKMRLGVVLKFLVFNVPKKFGVEQRCKIPDPKGSVRMLERDSHIH